jgi:CBS domain-containing protein
VLVQNLKAKQLLAFSPSVPAVVTAEAGLREVVEKVLEDRSTREVYVIDDEGRFFGVITLRRLARFVFMHEVPDTSSATDLLELASARTARDVALQKASYVGEDDSLAHVIHVMFEFDINEIPVVNNERIIVGSLNMLEILAAWHAGQLNDLTE